MARRRRRYHSGSGSGGTLTGDPTTGSVVPPRQPSFQYFRFGSCPPATIAKTTTHSLCFAVPAGGPLGLGRPGTSYGVSNSNVPAAAAVVLDGHRHDMSKYLLGRGDDNGGAVAKRKDDVQFFDFLGVGI
jgi:hypothetical protein